MKCKSCGENIELRMRKALAANECPYCGGGILDKETMQQFLDLHSVLDPQRFTDNQEYDRRIKEKTIRILMEHMKCVKTKDVKQEDDIVKIGEKKPTKRTISSAQAKDPSLIDEQKKMRNDIYTEAYKEQYGEEPAEVSAEATEDEVTEEDREAAKDVVFSGTGSPETEDKVAELKQKMVKPTGKNKPITRIS